MSSSPRLPLHSLSLQLGTCASFSEFFVRKLHHSPDHRVPLHPVHYPSTLLKTIIAFTHIYTAVRLYDPPGNLGVFSLNRLLHSPPPIKLVSSCYFKRILSMKECYLAGVKMVATSSHHDLPNPLAYLLVLSAYTCLLLCIDASLPVVLNRFHRYCIAINLRENAVCFL